MKIVNYVYNYLTKKKIVVIIIILIGVVGGIHSFFPNEENNSPVTIKDSTFNNSPIIQNSSNISITYDLAKTSPTQIFLESKILSTNATTNTGQYETKFRINIGSLSVDKLNVVNPTGLSLSCSVYQKDTASIGVLTGGYAGPLTMMYLNCLSESPIDSSVLSFSAQ